MQSDLDVKTIQQELRQAESARQSGNEGRARVCARRAAGWAVVVYRRQLGEAVDDENALRNLTWLQEVHSDERLQAAASRLMARVTKDHHLPHPEDPLEDARLTLSILLGDN